MCKQIFIVYLCGDVKNDDHLCDEARAADVPIWFKLDCPNYKCEKKWTDTPCGLGNFYCKHEQDGDFLEGVHASLKQRRAQQTVNAQRLIWEYSSVGEGPALLQRQMAHHAQGPISNARWALLQERKMVLSELRRLLAIARQARVYFERRAEHLARKDGRPFPALGFSPLLVPNRVPAELVPSEEPEQHIAAKSSPGPELKMMSGSRTATVSIPAQQARTQPAPVVTINDNAGRPIGDGRSVIRGGMIDTAIGFKALSEDCVLKKQDSYPDSKQNGVQTSERTQLGLQERVKDSSSMRDGSCKASFHHQVPDPALYVRRSARNLDKKVNYAQSDASSSYSRDASPVKSDFEPPLSQRSGGTPSPAKSELTHTRQSGRGGRSMLNATDTQKPHLNASLASLIGEWKVRNGIRESILPQPDEGHVGVDPIKPAMTFERRNNSIQFVTDTTKSHDSGDQMYPTVAPDSAFPMDTSID